MLLCGPYVNFTLHVIQPCLEFLTFALLACRSGCRVAQAPRVHAVVELQPPPILPSLQRCNAHISSKSHEVSQSCLFRMHQPCVFI
jgi:hypothetical protein